jgi:PEP-CTERM motif
MLACSIILGSANLSASGGPFAAHSLATSDPNGTRRALGEPSTFILALIGIGLITAYLVFTRRWRPQWRKTPISTASASDDVSGTKPPTREAA